MKIHYKPTDKKDFIVEIIKNFLLGEESRVIIKKHRTIKGKPAKNGARNQ